jgi:drug/metabolite transporter (DMT)-like permease
VTSISPGLAFALAAALGWALFDLSRRFLSARFSAWTTVVGVTLPSLPLILIWGWRAGPWWVEPLYLVPGLGSLALNLGANFAYVRAYQLSPISLTLPMLSLTPVFSALLGAAVLGEPVSLRAAVGIACVVAGAVVLAAGWPSRQGRQPVRVESGSLVMALVALLWSGSVLLDKLALRHASAPLHALVLNGGVAIGGLIALALSGRLAELRGLPRNGALLAFSVATGFGALAAQLAALGSIPIGMLETLKRGVGGVMAVTWGRTFFAEPVTSSKAGAIALLTAGVALILL